MSARRMNSAAIIFSLLAATHEPSMAASGHAVRAAGCTGSGAGAFLANGQTNVAAGSQSSVLGGNHNTVCDNGSIVESGIGNTIDSGQHSGAYSFIGGGHSNSSTGIEGFLGSGATNSLSGISSAVVAGSSNQLTSSDGGFIGSGLSNVLMLSENGVIGGGEQNQITNTTESNIDDRVIVGGSGNSMLFCTYCSRNSTPLIPSWGFIGGGSSNAGRESSEVVVGGGGNVSYGRLSSIPGGYHNLSRGDISFAAGFGSYALGNGTFVWSDFSSGTKHLTATNPSEFLVRASGGVTFFSNAAATTGVTLAPGSGAWASASDKFLKREFSAINYRSLLAQLVSLPVSRWTYTGEGSVRHVGPMAQEFYSNFHLGPDDRHITTIDEGGVALASVKQLLVLSNQTLISNGSLYDRLNPLYAAVADARMQLSAYAARAKQKHRHIRVAAACSGSGQDSFLANTQANVAAASATSVLGGSNNDACDDYSTVGGGSQNAIDSGNDSGGFSFIGSGSQNGIASSEAFIGAGSDNQISGGSAGAVVSGTSNSLSGAGYAFIGGGEMNAITDTGGASIGGGLDNVITAVNGSVTESGGASDAAIAGGDDNSIVALTVNGASDSFIGGGAANVVNGSAAVITGGDFNTAGGNMSTVQGGEYNSAAGQYSFAAGLHASALADGSFVWSDGSGPMRDTTTNTFAVLAPGGTTIYSNATATTGVALAAGGGSWASASDRALKADVRVVDPASILSGVSALPISNWSYKSEGNVRHVGPMSQDFYAAFRVGEDDRHITSVDEDGVALTAVKALHFRNRAIRSQDRSLSELIESLHQKNVAAESMLKALGLRSRSRSFKARMSAVCAGIGSGAFVANADSNVAAGAQASVGGGMSNSACDDTSTVSGGANNTINSGADAGPLSFLAAGTKNLVSSRESFVGSGDTNTITTSDSGAIAAGSSNDIQGSVGSFIGSGTENSIVAARAGTIFGGQGNSITAMKGAVTESGGASDAAIVGGVDNTISALSANGAAYAFIGGGYQNTATGQMAVIAGGAENVASGDASTVPGGYQNVAAGDSSFAAGYRSRAMTPGSFVWSDYSPSAAPLTATKANQFLVRASGGVTFYSNAAESRGVILSPGSGTWASVSDRSLKTRIEPIDENELLNRVSSLPIMEWSYISEFGVHHIGPMAQDFYAAFKVGEDNRHITMIDEDGVTLGAVKALADEGISISHERKLLLHRLTLLERETARIDLEIDQASSYGHP